METPTVILPRPEFYERIGNSTVFVLVGLPQNSDVQELSKTTKGYYYCSPRTITRCCGSNVETWIMRDDLAKLETSRKSVVQFLSANIARTEEMPKVGITYGRQCRAIAKFLIAAAALPTTTDLGITATQGKILLQMWHYQYCLPKRHVLGTLYDMNSAYWQIAERAPSPIINLKNQGLYNSITFPRQPAALLQRWEAAREFLEKSKALRVRFVGQCISGNSERTYKVFLHGDDIDPPLYSKSPLLGLGIACIRSTAELTYLQSVASNSRYSNIDSVFIDESESEATPNYWAELGIRYSVRGSGDSTFAGIGSWRCGRQETEIYENWDGVTFLPYPPSLKRPIIADPDFHIRFLNACDGRRTPKYASEF